MLHEHLERHGVPAVLILDEINLVAKNELKTLETIQLFAKQQADASTLVIIFVSSEGNALHQLLKNTAHLV